MLNLSSPPWKIHENSWWRREIANRLGISSPKVRKILLTIGAIQTDESRMHAAGMTVAEIAAEQKISEKAVSGRLPYTKGMYDAEYPTKNALRIRRSRQK